VLFRSWALVEGPVVFAHLVLSACPTSNDALEWQSVLAVLYHEAVLRAEFKGEGPLSVDGRFAGFQLPVLTEQEKQCIAPLATAVPRQLIDRYRAYPPPPAVPAFYAWRRDGADTSYRGRACDHVEYFCRRTWEKIAELTPRLLPDHGLDLTPPTSFIPQDPTDPSDLVESVDDDDMCDVCHQREGVKACSNGNCATGLIYCRECAVERMSGRFCRACAV
jgi:hypothetical protein